MFKWRFGRNAYCFQFWLSDLFNGLHVGDEHVFDDGALRRDGAVFYLGGAQKRPPIRAFVAGFLGFASIACLAFGGLSKLNFGDLLAFFCAVGFAVHYLVLDKATKSTPAGALTFVQMLTAAVLFFVVGFIVDGKAMLNCSFPKSIILPLFTLCVLNTAFAYIVQTRAQKTIDASKVSLVLSFESTLGAVFAVILGGDKFTWYLALSIIGMTAAILIAEWPQKNKRRLFPTSKRIITTFPQYPLLTTK